MYTTCSELGVRDASVKYLWGWQERDEQPSGAGRPALAREGPLSHVEQRKHALMPDTKGISLEVARRQGWCCGLASGHGADAHGCQHSMLLCM